VSSYIDLYNQGILIKIKQKLLESLKSCTLCPRKCKVNRLEEEMGFCQTGRLAKTNSFFLHFGEEPELVIKGGSGTIFFSYCNLGCLYCQNYSISHLGEGRKVKADDLAGMMIALQDDGAQNINFVTPTHVIAQIIEALMIAIEEGLNLPLVYNCGGYESVQTLRTVAGVFNIYMPDIKYSDNAIASKFSKAPDYWEAVKEAIKEMHRQVGDLAIEGGIAKNGLLVRHLVLPCGLAGSFKVLDFIKEVSPCTYINIMDQYHPYHRAHEFDELSRGITSREYLEVIEYAREIGLFRGF
jgi:putative pyruvate formate lyase activating enzyme